MAVEISRRSFLRGSAAGVAGAALSGWLGSSVIASAEENTTEIIQASDYSTATSTEDTTEMFAELNLRVAEESIVLLENKDNALPLASGTSITLIDAGDYRLSGSGSGGTSASDEATITPAEGIEANED
ncbi:MAG: twin-arginine translocation signal domain-containing protein, partial [Lachnospiraceae bacterium]|nr:twin-arginine translocation signal domain-containing protein [Lachnospiraceae bacterium]